MGNYYTYNLTSPFDESGSIIEVKPVEERDLIGEIKGYPKELVQEMIVEQIRQGNSPDITVFQKRITADKEDGGFNWEDSDKGENYWYYVIKNPDKYNININEIFNVKNEDIIKDISSLPIEVIKEMITEQIRQGNEPNISIFQESRASCKSQGGFSWEESKEGFEFWDEVLENENFNFFFTRYKKIDSTVRNRETGKPIYYIVEEKDLIGEIKDYPKELVQKMIDEQIRQGNEPNIETFQMFGLMENASHDQFSWQKSKYGTLYWDFVKTVKSEPLGYRDYSTTIHVYFGIRIYCGMIIKINELFSNKIGSYLVIRYKEDDITLINLEDPEKSELRSFCTIGEWNIVEEILDFPREYKRKRKVLYRK